MMLEQPLFWPERAPSLAPEGGSGEGCGDGGAAGPDGLVYLGVIVKGDERQVLLKDGGACTCCVKVRQFAASRSGASAPRACCSATPPPR